jgi:hypothetical protein
MGSIVLESKQHLSGSVIRIKQPVESCYAQQLSMAFLLLGEVPPSHGNGQDFPDSRFVYKCQALHLRWSDMRGKRFEGMSVNNYHLVILGETDLIQKIAALPFDISLHDCERRLMLESILA